VGGLAAGIVIGHSQAGARNESLPPQWSRVTEKKVSASHGDSILPALSPRFPSTVPPSGSSVVSGSSTSHQHGKLSGDNASQTPAPSVGLVQDGARSSSPGGWKSAALPSPGSDPVLPELSPANNFSSIHAINPNAPGNSMVSGDQKVAVEAAEPLPDGSTGLDLVATPAAIPASGKNPSIQQRRFTLEEELFRSKWGWSVFDEAKKMAAEAAAR